MGALEILFIIIIIILSWHSVRLKSQTQYWRGLSPWCGKWFFSQNQLSVQTLLRCPYSLRVQLNVSVAVCTLKIPNTGSHTTVWTTKMLHTLIRMGSAAFAAAVSYHVRETRISRKRQWSLKKEKKKVKKKKKERKRKVGPFPWSDSILYAKCHQYNRKPPKTEAYHT